MKTYTEPLEDPTYFYEPDADYSNVVCMDILTDFGFKHIFGKESHKDILIAFLNVLFQEKKILKDLYFNNTEQKGPTDTYRSVHFDLICTGDNNEQFIIEMQRANQDFFIDRCLFYNARLLIDQAPTKGMDWNYQLKGVYTISILEEKSQQLNTGDHYLTPVELVNRNTQETFFDKMGYIFLELSKFDKPLDALETDLDRWCYVLKHLHRLKKLPRYLNQDIFQRIFKLAQVAQLPTEERIMYDRTLKAKRDWNNMLDYAKRQAVAEGKAEGKAEVAQALLVEGLPINKIAQITGLPVETIQYLQTK